MKSPHYRIARDVETLRSRLHDGESPVHVSGRGYDGIVALHFALRHPERVASLTLHEPADLISLFEDGLHSAAARQVRRLHDTIVRQSDTAFGRWRAARDYVNYWFGRHAWRGLSARQKARNVALVPKFAAEMDALMSASARIADPSVLTVPVTIFCRSRARRPARRICELLHERLPHARLEWLKEDAA